MLIFILTFCAQQPYRIFNTWLGDEIRLVILGAVLKEIQRQNLIRLVRDSGDVLLSGLRELEVGGVTAKQSFPIFFSFFSIIILTKGT